MGVVYLARAEGAAGFAKPVVVKRVLPGLTGDERMTRLFVREAKILSNMQHPNIVGVTDFGEEDGAHIMVLDYVRAYQLGPVARVSARAAPGGKGRACFQIEGVVHVMIKVLDALEYSHGLTLPDGSPLENRALRHLAGEHPRRHRRTGEAARLRYRSNEGRADAGDGRQVDSRKVLLPAHRGARWLPTDADDRRLRVRRRALRAAGGRESVHGSRRDAHNRARHLARASAAEPGAPGRVAGARCNRGARDVEGHARSASRARRSSRASSVACRTCRRTKRRVRWRRWRRPTTRRCR